MTSPYRKILVPLDGSPFAERVLNHLVLFGKPEEMNLIVLSVFEAWRYSLSPGHPADPETLARIRAVAEGYLARQAEGLRSAGYTVDTRLLEGDATQGILAMTRSAPVDLIAMTTHGRSGFVRFALGSIAERVVQGADLPVLLVKESTNTATAPAQRLLVPLDGSQLAEQALKPAAALAKSNGASIFLFQAIQPPEQALQHVLFQNSASADSALALWRTNALEYLRQIANALQTDGITCHYQVALGAPDQAICEYAVRENADMILMTTHGLSGLRRWVYGSVTNKVLRNTCGPVMVIRSTQTA